MSEVESLALDYLPVIFFLVIGAVISGLFVVGSVLLAPSKPDPIAEAKPRRRYRRRDMQAGE